MKILVTGAAGFIGFHLVKNLVSSIPKSTIFGIDNINNYYDVDLKYSRLNQLGYDKSNISCEKFSHSRRHENFQFLKCDITDEKKINEIFRLNKFEIVIHLAAQAGVRYSIKKPSEYISSNILGFYYVLQACKEYEVDKFIYASSSSVYGNNEKVPFIESDNTDNPISLYAATKKSNEIIAQSYSELYGLKTIGLRFFTVYGPYGRPDMAYFIFTKSIINNKVIDIYNNGDMLRDFTYVDDIVNGIKNITISKKNIQLKSIYNIGNGDPVNLLKFIKLIEENLNKKALTNFLPIQKGDVYKTWANTESLKKDINYSSSIKIDVGIKKFIKWYKNYYNRK